MPRSSVLSVLVFAACAGGRTVPPTAPAPVAVASAPKDAAPPPSTTEPVAVAPPEPEPASAVPDDAAIAAALEHATLTVHTAQKYAGGWPAELDAERGPTVFLVELELELASYAYRVDPDKLLLETTTGDIVSQSPVTHDARPGRMTALFVLSKALQAKSLVLSYEGKHSKPFKLATR